jgi:two-component system LytT family response regulator
LPASASRSPLRILIVDDEPLAREGLRDGVARLSATGGLPELAIVGVCENGVTALAAIHEHEPDVVLLDIAMPVLDAFAMLERLEPEHTPPAIVFITAYDEHAVRAFDTEAVDFLVKPVADERLAAALARAVRRIDEARALRAQLDAAADNGKGSGRYVDRLVIPERGRHLVVPVSDIAWIEGETYYVRVHAQGQARLLRERLATLETALDPNEFHRTHRSAIVRLALIRELRAESPYTYSALLSTGHRAPVSRERLRGLEAKLGRGRQ